MLSTSLPLLLFKMCMSHFVEVGKAGLPLVLLVRGTVMPPCSVLSGSLILEFSMLLYFPELLR